VNQLEVPNLQPFELYMWISAGIFLFIFLIIFLAKLLQFFRRWGKSKAEGLIYTENVKTIPNSGISIPYLEITPNDTEIKQCILIFTPYTVSQKKFLYFGTALALNNLKVILVESRPFVKQVKEAQNDFNEIYEGIHRVFDPNVVIAADILFPLFDSMIREQNELKFIFFRPIMDPNQLSPLRYLPFTGQWFQALKLRKFRNFISSSTISPKFHVREDVLYVWPNKPPKSIQYTNDANQFIFRSGFSFHNYETLIFTKILQFI
jgi:hypothetical protein